MPLRWSLGKIVGQFYKYAAPTALIPLDRKILKAQSSCMNSPAGKSTVFCLIIFTAAIVVLAGCAGKPTITVINQSDVILSNVVASGSGFTNQIGYIAPKTEKLFSVDCRGESGLRLVFEAAGKHIDSGEQGYFEAGEGYRVTAMINTNLDISISSDF